MALGGAVAAILDRDPAAQITAIEIDPEVIDLARKLVPRIDRPDVRMVAADARLFLREDRGEYDYVLVDLFAGEQLPPHCVTEEFFRLAKDRLAPDGVMFMNTNLWDWEVETGLEPAPVPVPVRNVHAALYAAGFATLLQNDYFETGHLYAFPRPTPLAEVTDLLDREARRETTPADLRASYAAAALNLKAVPESRRELRPIRDEWVPENLLHLKENFEGYVRALTGASARPGGPPPSPIAPTPGGSWPTTTRLRCLRGEGPGRLHEDARRRALCTDLLAWARGAPRGSTATSRYVRSEVLRSCADAWETPDAGARGHVPGLRARRPAHGRQPRRRRPARPDRRARRPRDRRPEDELMPWIRDDVTTQPGRPADGHHLRPIRAADAEIDFPAVMACRERLFAQYGDAWGWPEDDMTLEDDRQDLARHEREMVARESWDYAILDADETTLLGCVYIDPPGDDCPPGTDAVSSWWVVDAALGTPLERAVAELVPTWLATTWGFRAVHFDPMPPGASPR